MAIHDWRLMNGNDGIGKSGFWCAPHPFPANLAICACHAIAFQYQCRAMTRPQVEFCAKLLIVAISGTFLWALYNVLALIGVF
jgi:hypothetical protein